MSVANKISLSIVLVADYSPVGNGVATGNYDGGLNVLVPGLGDNLSFKYREQLVCLLFSEVRLWVWCVDGTNLVKLSPCQVEAQPFLGCL